MAAHVPSGIALTLVSLLLCCTSLLEASPFNEHDRYQHRYHMAQASQSRNFRSSMRSSYMDVSHSADSYSSGFATPQYRPTQPIPAVPSQYGSDDHPMAQLYVLPYPNTHSSRRRSVVVGMLKLISFPTQLSCRAQQSKRFVQSASFNVELTTGTISPTTRGYVRLQTHGQQPLRRGGFQLKEYWHSGTDLFLFVVVGFFFLDHRISPLAKPHQKKWSPNGSKDRKKSSHMTRATHAIPISRVRPAPESMHVGMIGLTIILDFIYLFVQRLYGRPHVR